MCLSTKAELNKPVQLTFRFKATVDFIRYVDSDLFPTSVISIMLPEDIQLSAGELIWKGQLKKDEEHTTTITFVPLKKGNYKINAIMDSEVEYLSNDEENVEFTVD